GLLRRQNVYTGAEQVARDGAGSRDVPNRHGDAGRGIDDVRAGNGVGDAIAELEIANAHAVREGAGAGVKAGRVAGRVVDVREGLIRTGNERRHVAVLLKTIFEEDVDARGQVVVQTANPLLIAERAVEGTSEGVEGGLRLDRSEQVLRGA